MSLFKVCTWWSVQCPDVSESYDSASILCCRLGLEENDKDYIVVGSHTGHLSIFYPTSELVEEGYFTGYTPTDLVLESKLKAPILGLTSGKFGSSNKINENGNQLVILHPLSVCIYNVTSVAGVADFGTHSTLQLAVEHKLSSCSYSICKGNFGGFKGREFLCVTHLDGSLMFFEQDGISYSCKLPGDHVIPCPLVYVSRSDSFIRVNSIWELESFSYQDLSESAVNKTVVTPTWSICIGEFPTDIVAVQVTNTKTSIMILGERNLINISDDGKLQFIKKLDYSPKCFCPFVLGWYWEPNARLVTAVVSETGGFFIYENNSLIWAAQLEEAPIAILRSNLSSLPGGIVMLDSKGLVLVGFLGSEPYVFHVPPLNQQDLDFEKAQDELQELENEIKRSIDLTDSNMINSLAEQDLELRLTVFQDLKACTFEIPSDLEGIDKLMCRMSIQFKTNINMDQIQITMNAAEGINCSQRLFTFNEIPANTSEVVEVWFYVCEKIQIFSTKVEVIVSFINKQSIPRVLIKECFLPSKLFYRLVSPQKESAIKITITVNLSDKSKIPKLSDIFSELTTESDIQALGLLALHSDNVVTIVTAKSSNRLRVQSDSLEAMASILEIVVSFCQNLDMDQIETRQLGTKKKKNKRRPKTVVCTPTIPIEEVMRRVLYHHEIQQEIKDKTVRILAYMDALWNQFRLFQRRLQSKNESDPIDGLMMLIEINYDDLVAEGDILMKIREDERRAKNNLSCAIALVRHIISCLDIDERILESILPAFVYPIEDWTEKSWEETSATSFDRINQHGPLSKSKNTPLDISPSYSKYEFEFDRFKRHMTSLMDRVCRLATDRKQQRLALAPLSNSKNRIISDQVVSESSSLVPIPDISSHNLSRNSETDENLNAIASKDSFGDDDALDDGNDDENSNDDGKGTVALAEEQSDWINDLPSTIALDFESTKK